MTLSTLVLVVQFLYQFLWTRVDEEGVHQNGEYGFCQDDCKSAFLFVNPAEVDPKRGKIQNTHYKTFNCWKYHVDRFVKLTTVRGALSLSSCILPFPIY